MRAVGWIVVLFALSARGTGAARADDFSFQGYVDVRLVAPPNEESWLGGGLGKLRFGSQGGGPTGRFAEAVGQADWRATPYLTTVVVLRAEPDQRTGVDALEAYARLHPQPVGDWQYSLKAGVFFPPISLENNDLGWTSPYTLTPSAIDSWVGDELRTIGTEARLEWHTGLGTLAALGAAFCCNDPAGVLMAERGWSLDDRPTGYFETLHEPNISLELVGHSAPDRAPIFIEIDNRSGFYGGGTWDVAGLGPAQFLYYDNQGDPAAHDQDYDAWHTRFWSGGVSTRIADVAFLAQALRGSTDTEEHPPYLWTTQFWSAYGLASYDLGDWRLSARADLFGTGENEAFWQAFGEHGRAATAAVSWMPKDWLRLTAEFVGLNAQRLERVAAGLSKNEADDQFQLSLRASI